MNEPTAEWATAVVRLLAIAERLEAHGQINIAKLARAAADSFLRRAAYRLELPYAPEELAGELARLLATLPGFGLDDHATRAMERGVAALAEGRLPLFSEMPNPYVCRTCGELFATMPDAQCPTCGAWPATFQEFKPIYWLDDLEPGEALAQLEETPERVAALLAGLDEAQLTAPAADGGWSMRQVLSHLRDAEGVLHLRLQRMVEQENPTLESLAVFAWATSENDRPPATADIYQSYRDSRRESLEILNNLPPGGWWRTGQHQEFGEVTIRQQASYFSAHEQTHLAALVALRQAALS